MNLFEGLHAFPITPMDSRGDIDHAGLAELIEAIAETSVDAIGLLGSTGSYVYLDNDQRRAAIATARTRLRGRLPLIVGVGALTTDAALRHARQAIALGADGLLLAPVSYVPLFEDEVARHFEAIASAVSRPVCIYDNPTTTHFTFTPPLIDRLAQHPNIQGLKTPADAEVATRHAELAARLGNRLRIGYSVDAYANQALSAGGSAWHSVMAGVFPRACADIVTALRRGDADAARQADARLQPLWTFCRHYSSYRVAHESARLIGLDKACMPRPIRPLAEPVREALRRLLATAELL